MRRLLGWLGVLVLAAGCSNSPDALPKTYPVKGTVLDAKGVLLKAGAVRFVSKTDTTITTTGEIQPDGGFTLNSGRNKEQAQGAPEGEYTVEVQQMGGPDPNNPPPLKTLPKTYKVEARENVFELKLPK